MLVRSGGRADMRAYGEKDNSVTVFNGILSIKDEKKQYK
jgi:hypothetical protein